MIPTGLGTLLILLAFVPGWIYLRLLTRLQPQSRSGGLGEVLEVLSVGAATTGIACLAFILLPHRWLPFAVDVDRLAREGQPYLRTHVRPAASTVVLIFVCALAIAYGTYWVRRLRLPDEFRPQGNVWVHSLGTRPKGTVPWIGIRLTNGRHVEGMLHAFSLNDEADTRDIALAKPIRVTEPECTEPVDLGIDRVVFSSAQIEYIAAIHVPQAEVANKTLLRRLPERLRRNLWSRLRRRGRGRDKV